MAGKKEQEMKPKTIAALQPLNALDPRRGAWASDFGCYGGIMHKRRNVTAVTFVLVGIAFFCINADTYAASEIPREADTSVSGIFLFDPDSTNKVLGKNTLPTEINCALPTIKFYNTSKTEILTLVFFNGDVRDSVAEFHISSSSSKSADLLLPRINVNHFVSGKGIHLGISKKELTKILGYAFIENKNGNQIILKYEIDDFDNSQFLKKYNLPVYLSSYVFDKDTLVKLEFGFEYP